MKKYLLLALAAICLSACKKESAKSLTELVDETVWTGELKYQDREYAEPYSIEFDGKGGFSWYEVSGKGTGTYLLDESNRVITLTTTSGPGVSFAFKPTGNGSIGETNLPQFAYASIYYGSVVKAVTGSIDNTTWTGTIAQFLQQVPYELKFKPFNKMSYFWDTPAHTSDFDYTRNKASVSYTYGSNGFGIFKGDSIIGSHSAGGESRPFRIKKK